MAEYNFNPGAHTPRFGGGDNLGVGKHPVVGTSVELKNAKSGQGGYLELKVAAIDGPEKGNRTSIRFNLHHSNPETVRIAEEQLAATCLVMGISGPWSNTDILLNKPFVIDVAMQAGSDKYTEVTAVYTMDGKTASPVAAGGGNGGGGFGGFGNGASQTQDKPAEQQAQGGAQAGGWGGATAAQETKPAGTGAATGGGWGQNAGGGNAAGASAGGWQQNSGGGAGWGQSA